MVLANKQLIDVGDKRVASLDDLVTVIRVNGGLLLKPRGTSEANPPKLTLSRREIEILNLVAEGNSNKQVASLFQISEHTVKNHITSIMWKLDANDRTHAVVIALRQGWLSI